jgi:hypothetical protein
LVVTINGIEVGMEVLRSAARFGFFDTVLPPDIESLSSSFGMEGTVLTVVASLFAD